MKLREFAAPDFDLAMTLDSGQVFHWEKLGRGFVGAIDETAVYISKWQTLNFSGAPAQAIVAYFGLDHPLDEICATFPSDATMKFGPRICQGLRIIRQSKWGMPGDFYLLLDETGGAYPADLGSSSPSIRNAKQIRDREIFTFPTPKRLARTSQRELRACALGYRAAIY